MVVPFKAKQHIQCDKCLSPFGGLYHSSEFLGAIMLQLAWEGFLLPDSQQNISCYFDDSQSSCENRGSKTILSSTFRLKLPNCTLYGTLHGKDTAFFKSKIYVENDHFKSHNFLNTYLDGRLLN